MLSIASVSAHPLISVFASTGMVIWAAVGLVGLISGLVTVRVARRKNQSADHAIDRTQLGGAAQTTSLDGAGPVSADEVTQAA